MKKKAFLFSGGINHQANYVRYRNNLGFARKLLLEKYGYEKQDVYIMYANGQPLEYEGEHIPTLPAYKEFFYQVMEELQMSLSPQDQLLFLTSNHGGMEAEAILNLWEEEYYTLSEIRDMLEMIPCKKACVFAHCYGGNFQNLCSADTFFMSANQENRKSYRRPSNEDYDEFLFHFLSYLNGAYPDGTRVENEEKGLKAAFHYAFAHDAWNPACKEYANTRKLWKQWNETDTEEKTEVPLLCNCLKDGEDFYL